MLSDYIDAADEERKRRMESNCCEHGIQLMTPSVCYRCLREEVSRLEGLILEAESDIKAMGIEAHPAVLMRLDRLVRRIRAQREENVLLDKARVDNLRKSLREEARLREENARLRQRVEELDLGQAHWDEMWREQFARAEAAKQRVEELARQVGLQEAALDVWKKAHPTDDGTRLAALAVRR